MSTLRTTDQAETLLRLLTTQIWGVRENSRARAGTPRTMILNYVLC